MNTPTRPLEASGTSGEKAEMNGCLLYTSSLDADLYEKCNANPVLLLERLSYDRKEAIVKDKETMAKVKNVRCV